MRDERNMLTTSVDKVMQPYQQLTKEILKTHTEVERKFDVRPYLQLTEEILRHPTSVTFGNPSHAAPLDMKSLYERIQQPGIEGMHEELRHLIQKISCEISYMCSKDEDRNRTTVALFNTLSSYSWEAKVVLALTAFAVTYGEFWLMLELYDTDDHQLAKSLALLKHLPDLVEHLDTVKHRFEKLRNLIQAMLDVTNCIIQFNNHNLPPNYLKSNEPPYSVATDQFPTAVHLTVRSVVACAHLITQLITLGHKFIPSTTKDCELSNRKKGKHCELCCLKEAINNIHEFLTKQLALCYKHVEEKKCDEAFDTLTRLFKREHQDNMKILKALVSAKDDMPPLFDSSTKTRVEVEVLKKKNVLLLISDSDISQEELSNLKKIYRESRDPPTRIVSQYEVVWLPVVDTWTEAKQRDFDQLQSNMRWYSVHRPSFIHPAVIKYIKEVWRFNKKPILVVLDPQGSVVSPNALDMMWVWGRLAFPFTSMTEEALWKEATWGLELLVHDIDQHVINWIMEERFICLYGGEDIEWIRKFTTTTRAVAQEAGIPFEMVYVGKSKHKDQVGRNISVITMEKLSHCWPDLTSIWFFWVRLESMWHSEMRLGSTIEKDHIMQEIMTMLTFDGSEQGWALISKGSTTMVKAKGDLFLECFQQYENVWKKFVDVKGFMQAIIDHLQQLQQLPTPYHCSRLILPDTVGMFQSFHLPMYWQTDRLILKPLNQSQDPLTAGDDLNLPEIICSKCGRPMEKFVMYMCLH